MRNCPSVISMPESLRWSPSHPSIVAQAVMVVCYELFQASTEIPKKPCPISSVGQLERMFEHMEKTLIQIGFLESKYPKESCGRLDDLFGRSQMDEREVQMLHGIWSQMDHRLSIGKRP